MENGPQNTPEVEAGPQQEKTRESLSHSVQHTSVREKIKLAMTGDREARTLLLKDANKQVQEAVLNNPRITDHEIVSLATSRSVNDELLRKVSDNRNWIKNYQVRVALVNNPKTPPHISLGLIRHLRDFDLRSLRWSKNLPGVITTAIKQLMQERRDRR